MSDPCTCACDAVCHRRCMSSSPLSTFDNNLWQAHCPPAPAAIQRSGRAILSWAFERQCLWSRCRPRQQLTRADLHIDRSNQEATLTACFFFRSSCCFEGHRLYHAAAWRRTAPILQCPRCLTCPQPACLLTRGSSSHTSSEDLLTMESPARGPEMNALACLL